MTRSSLNLITKKALATAIGAMMGFGATSVSAQQEDRRALQIEEILVTARRVEESLQDTPVAVTAFSAENLEQIGFNEAGDVAKFTPGLVMRKQSGAQSNYAVAIRGVSMAETALAIDPTVGIYQDGVYIARNTGAAFDIVDVQRIEVLRGPQGALFGRNTIGGAVNIITQKPKGEFAFYQLGTYGDEGYYRLKTTIDTPSFADGTMAAKFSYLRTGKDGELESYYNGGELGQNEATAYRLALSWNPSDDFSVDLIYDKSDRNSNNGADQLTQVRPLHVFLGGSYFQTATQFDAPGRLSKLPKIETGDELTTSDVDGTSLTANWTVSPNLSIKSITSYREWDSRARATEFGSFPAPSDFSLIDIATFQPVTPGTFVPIFGAKRKSHQRQLTQEFQFNGNLMDGRLNYTSGLYYFEEQANESNPQQFVLPATILGIPFPSTSFLVRQPFFAYATDNKAYAAYLQATYTLFKDFDVTLGMRYTIDERETTLTNTLLQEPTDPPTSTSLQTITDDDDWSSFNPSITFDYRWNEQVSTYFKVATGYRAGGYNVRANAVSTFSKPFDNEDLISYEIGLKTDLLDRRLRFNATAYHMQYEDRQVAQFSAGSGGASTVIVNAGESTSTGLELEGTFIVAPGLRVMGTYSYLDLEYDEFITGGVDRVTGFPTGVNVDIADTANENLYAPEQSGSLAVEYEFAPWDFGRLTLRVDGTYTDSISFHSQFNLYNESDAHTLINARATLADIPLGAGKLKLSAWGKNLGDTEYRQFGIDFASLGFTINDFGQLRSWGLDVVYEFNR